MQTSSTESTSHSLLQLAKERDAAAWERLASIYSPLVYQWCRRAGVQNHDVADISQEVFQAVAGALAEFRKDKPGYSFRGWLWTITRNKIRDFVRQQRRQPSAVGGPDANQQWKQLADDQPESDEFASDFPNAKLAKQALALMQTDFSEPTWKAFWRTAIDGQRAADVADELGLPLAAVYMAKSRVLRRLREELDGLDLV